MSERTQGVDAPEKRQKESFGELLRTVVYALAIALVFRTVLYQPFHIPSGSMKGTLLIGDYLFVSKFSYGLSRYSVPFGSRLPGTFDGRLFFSPPERGDVAVFRDPTPGRDHVDLIKRVVGLPGEEIAIIDGLVHIDGAPIEQTAVADYFEPRLPGRLAGSQRCERALSSSDACGLSQYSVTLDNGVTHRILSVDGARLSGDNFGPYRIPNGQYFMMGDNRDNSGDSRVFGPVPVENFVGRAEFILLSSGSWRGQVWQFWNWRSDRFFESVE